MAYQLDPKYVQLRDEAFHWDSQAPQGALRGVIMETGYPDGIITLAAMSDSSISVYFSHGAGMVGLGSHDRPAAAARNLAVGVAQNMELFKKTSDTKAPKQGEVKFFVLVDKDVLGASAKEEELGANKHKLSPVFHAAHAVLTEAPLARASASASAKSARLMQGPVAQALALVCVGNAALRGYNVVGFWPDSVVFGWAKSCDFRCVECERDELIAADPLAWIETLRAADAVGLRLHHATRPRGAQQTSPISDRMLAGFVGGGPAWLIEVVAAKNSATWQGFDRLGDRGAVDRKIWLTSYLLQRDTATFEAPELSLAAASAKLDGALRDIEALSPRLSAYNWAEIFVAARAVLGADDPPADALLEDFEHYARLDASQLKLLAAASESSVFGGMGSWNDVSPDESLVAEHETKSEALFQALNNAISAIANSTFAV